MKKAFLNLFIFISVFSSLTAQNSPDSVKVEKQFTIENCVTEFSMYQAEKKNAGYQFWFADRDFIDGRTLVSIALPM